MPPTISAPRSYAPAPTAQSRPLSPADDAPRAPVSGLFHLALLVVVGLVLAGVYIAGTLLDIGILHTIALCAGAGALMTAFMASDLRHS